MTEMQKKILDALVAHGSNKVIAKHLELPLRTVENNLRAAMDRLGVNNRVHAALVWDRSKR